MNDNEQRPKAEEIEGEKLPYPAKQSDMKRQPDSDLSNYLAAGKLKGKVAIITGADSGIGKIKVPVLVAAGEKDEMMTAKLLKREIVRRIETARLVVVPEVNHLLPLEAPKETADLIRRQVENSSCAKAALQLSKVERNI